MKFKRITAFAVTAAMALGAVPTFAAESGGGAALAETSAGTETVSYTYSYGDANTYTREMEALDRGLVAVKTTGGVYLSWRLMDSEDAIFGSADSDVSFDIYRDGEYIATETDTTNYIDASGTASSTYAVVEAGASLENSISVDENDKTKLNVNAAEAPLTAHAAKYSDSGALEKVEIFDVDSVGESAYTADFEIDKAFLWDGMTPVDGTAAETVSVMSNNYFDIPLDVPASVKLADGTTYSYSAGDASCGDLDGDGEYEIVLKWDCNAQDNSNSGYTGDVYLDAYKLDGTMLWRVDLGENIRSGAHYTQFLVYDFDLDGCAEVTAKTAPGSKDGLGNYVTAASHVDEIAAVTDSENETSYVNDGGYILDGDEYFTIFNGLTGAAEDTIYYPNQRIDVTVWGDSYGNRCDRYTATMAYLDGATPYAVYMRGYYMRQSGGAGERQAACAVSFDGEALDCEYSFDTYDSSSYSSKSSSASYDSDGNYKGVDGYVSGNEIYVGEGNHNCTVADVDNDGCDEVITGALCYKIIDGVLSPLWCTFLEHGDALHIGDYDPTHDGLEFFTVHEDSGTNTLSGIGVTMDYGATVIDPATGEILFHVSAGDDTGRGTMVNTGQGGYYQITGSAGVGTYIAEGNSVFTKASTTGGTNFRVFWDGDLYDELLDGTTVTSWGGSSFETIFNAGNYDCIRINGTKANPALQADLFGDWREELVYPTSDNTALRIFTTTTETDYKIKTLMHDPVYRSGVAAEQTAYNQPPHVGFYMDDDVFYGTLTGIYVDAANSDTTCYAGEEFDKTQLTVMAQYADSEDKAVTSFSVSGYDSSKSVTQTVTVTYKDYSTTVEVNVIGISSLTLAADSVKTSYYAGDALDTTGLAVTANYADGTSKEITDYTVSGYNAAVSGEQTITVSYIDASATYGVAVIGESGITAEISQTEYGVGDELDTAGITAELQYADDTSKKITGFEVSGFDGMAVGKQTLTVTYTGVQDTYTAELEVEVVSGLIIKDGVITGYNGDDTEIIIPLYDGEDEITAIADGALSASGLKKIYIYSTDIILDGDDIFPDGVTIVCYADSTAQAYAAANGIAYELISEAITFDEDFYSGYIGSNLLIQSSSAQTLTDEENGITYYTHAISGGAPWSSLASYGFSLAQEDGNNYLSVCVGIYDDMNTFNQIYYTMSGDASALSDIVSAEYSFAFRIPSATISPYIEIQDDEGTIDTISVSADGLSNDTWYTYELTYDGETYTRTIYDEGGNAVTTASVSPAGSTLALTTVFKQVYSWGNSADGVVNIDDIYLGIVDKARITFNVSDTDNNEVTGASVVVNSAKYTSADSGSVSVSLEDGGYAVRISAPGYYSETAEFYVSGDAEIDVVLTANESSEAVEGTASAASEDYEDFEFADGSAFTQTRDGSYETVGDITYYPGSRGDGGDGITGFRLTSGSDNSYLSVGAGKWNTSNRNAVIFFDNTEDFGDDNCTLSMDIMFDGNQTYNMTVTITDAEISAPYSGTTISSVGVDSISALESDVWYTYTLEYSAGGFTETFTDADGKTVYTTNVTSDAEKFGAVSFTADGGNAYAYIDNVSVTKPAVGEKLTLTPISSDVLQAEALFLADGTVVTLTPADGADLTGAVLCHTVYDSDGNVLSEETAEAELDADGNYVFTLGASYEVYEKYAVSDSGGNALVSEFAVTMK